MVTTDYNDTVYVGYYQSGKETTSYSNVANSQDNGPDGTKPMAIKALRLLI